MSQPETDIDFDEDKYRGRSEVEFSEIDGADDAHPIADALGNAEHREFEYDARRTGERFAFRYDSIEAWLREYVANMQTACVRAARHQLAADGMDADRLEAMGTEELLETAEAETGYQPTIEIDYSHPEADIADVTMADNGIGISVEEFLVVKKIGLSASNAEGRDLGQFGQGLMSGFMPVGKRGQFEFVTRSRLDDASYRERMRITGTNDMPGRRERYGTTFRFPAVLEKVHDLDMYAVIEEMQAGFMVPIIYREFDARSQLVSDRCEEWGHTPMADTWGEDVTTIYHEDEYVEAITGPMVSRSISHEDGHRNPKTYLISQQIERNEGISSNYRHGAPWHFDVRLKDESGPVYQCTCADADHTGLYPVERPTWESLDEDEREECVQTSEIGDDVVMPSPVDDKDRLQGNHKAFWRALGDKLKQGFRERMCDMLLEVDEAGTDAFARMDEGDVDIYRKGWETFMSNLTKPSASTIVSDARGELGAHITTSGAEVMAVAQLSVSHASREKSAESARLISNRKTRKVRDVLAEADTDGTVWMAKTINVDKTKLAWALHENNQVVAVDDYEPFESLDGWEMLKDLTLYDIAETYDAIDADSDLTRLDRRRRSNTSGSKASASVFDGEVDGLDPRHREVKLRIGSGSADVMRTVAGRTVKQSFDGDDSYTHIASRRIDRLVVYSDDCPVDIGGDGVPYGVGYTLVPSYVYDYLLGADRIFESLDAALADRDDPIVSMVYDIDGGMRADGQPYSFGEMGTESYALPSRRLSSMDSDTLVYIDSERRLAEIGEKIEGETDLTDTSALGPFLESIDAETRWLSLEDETASRLALLSSDEVSDCSHLFFTRGEPCSPEPEDAPTVVFGRESSGRDRNSITYDYRMRNSTVIDLEALVLEQILEESYPTERFPRRSAEWEFLEPSSTESPAIDVLDALDEYYPEGGPCFPSVRESEMFDAAVVDREGADEELWTLVGPQHYDPDMQLARETVRRICREVGLFEGDGAPVEES